MKRFSIRSFGSWGEAQFPQIGIIRFIDVSVSALSDRGVRPRTLCGWGTPTTVSVSALSDRGVRHRSRTVESSTYFQFQYPLFRIVG